MDSNERRQEILSLIKERTQPIKGNELAKIFNVSRQIIVQDIAIIRAEGENILATPQGYILPFHSSQGIKKIIACQHKPDEMFSELVIIVDMGGKIIDVIVEHPIYGEIKANLMINSRKDLEDFINSFQRFQAEPLSILTEGIHLHTIEVPDEKTYQEITTRLKEDGYLVAQ